MEQVNFRSSLAVANKEQLGSTLSKSKGYDWSVEIEGRSSAIKSVKEWLFVHKEGGTLYKKGTLVERNPLSIFEQTQNGYLFIPYYGKVPLGKHHVMTNDKDGNPTRTVQEAEVYGLVGEYSELDLVRIAEDYIVAVESGQFDDLIKKTNRYVSVLSKEGRDNIGGKNRSQLVNDANKKGKEMLENHNFATDLYNPTQEYGVDEERHIAEEELSQTQTDDKESGKVAPQQNTETDKEDKKKAA